MSLNSNLARHLYRTHLRRFRVMRATAKLLDNVCFRLRVWTGFLRLFTVGPVLSRRALHDAAARKSLKRKSYFSRRYSLVSVGAFAASKAVAVLPISSTQLVTVAGPRLFEGASLELLPTEPVAYEAPAVRVVELPEVGVVGRSDFIYNAEVAIHHDLLNLAKHSTVEETQARLVVDRRRYALKRITFCSSEPFLSLEKAISVLGGCTNNYVHWLTEKLPLIALLQRLDTYRDWPVLVDESLPPNMRESLELFLPPGHAIIPVPEDALVWVDRFAYISPAVYVPFDYHPPHFQLSEHVRYADANYSPDMLRALRERCDDLFGQAIAEPGKRLYIRRSAKSRTIVNREEVETFLIAEGFKVIEPETMTFAEQVALFRGASVIVAQAGAGLGNLLFAPSACTTVVLSAYSSHSNYAYFSTMASLLGQDLRFILGEPIDSPHAHPSHRDFRVPMGPFSALVREALGQAHLRH